MIECVQFTGMPTLPTSRRPFAWALALLIASAAFCGYTIYRLEASEQWLHHTYNVQLGIAGIEHSLTKAGRGRTAFVESSDPASLEDFEDASAAVPRQLANLRQQIADNPGQIARLDALAALAQQRLQILQKSVDLKKSGQSDPAAQTRFTLELVRAGIDTASTADAMQRAEDALLQKRSSLTSTLLSLTLAAIFATFAVSAVLFWINDRMLGRQLHERQAAEHNAQLLSTALMRIQDEERRKFSRELHDSLGQTLAAAKMLADSVSSRLPEDAVLTQLCKLLENALKETRTLSQLLHPPLLDEVGFMSAAHWFMEEFSRRTGVNVDFRHDPDFPELPKNVELTLFRILQEALTNVHRHANSSQARVELNRQGNQVRLAIRDYGVGFPEEKLARFQSNGSGVGVGLAGMRNRVREQGGTLSVTSESTGTIVLAELPTDYALNAPESPPRGVARTSTA